MFSIMRAAMVMGSLHSKRTPDSDSEFGGEMTIVRNQLSLSITADPREGR